MKLSCAAMLSPTSDTLLEKLEKLPVTPIITPSLIRVVYEGPDKTLGLTIIELFEEEPEHDINVIYDKAEQSKSERRMERKAKKAKHHNH